MNVENATISFLSDDAINLELKLSSLSIFIHFYVLRVYKSNNNSGQTVGQNSNATPDALTTTHNKKPSCR